MHICADMGDQPGPGHDRACPLLESHPAHRWVRPGDGPPWRVCLGITAPADGPTATEERR